MRQIKPGQIQIHGKSKLLKLKLTTFVQYELPLELRAGSILLGWKTVVHQDNYRAGEKTEVEAPRLLCLQPGAGAEWLSLSWGLVAVQAAHTPLSWEGAPFLKAEGILQGPFLGLRERSQPAQS